MARKIALTILLVLSLSLTATAQAPQMRTLSFPQWGFSALIPEGSQKQTISKGPKSGMYDAYTYNGMGYVIFIEKAPKGVEPQQAIQQMQSQLTILAPLLGVRRWQIESLQGTPFSGFSVSLPNDQNVEKNLEPWMIELLKGEPFATSQSMAMVDNKAADANQFVIGVGTIGPKSRSNDLENAAKFLTRNIKWLNPRFALGDPTKPGGIRAPSAAASPQPKLKSGHIALVGVVDIIAADGKSFEMLVDEVTSFGQETAKLKPARLKSVVLDKPKPEIKPGIRVLVVGPDSGKGKPISASSVQTLPE